MNKKQRHDIIVNLITKSEISTQEELSAALQDAGLNVTQATVSRDINELGLKKISGKVKKFKYALPLDSNAREDERMTNLLLGVMISIEAAENLVVLKTYSGNAGTAGAIIDKLHIDNVLGTIAGDDVLLIIARDSRSAHLIVEKIKGIL